MPAPTGESVLIRVLTNNAEQLAGLRAELAGARDAAATAEDAAREDRHALRLEIAGLRAELAQHRQAAEPALTTLARLAAAEVARAERPSALDRLLALADRAVTAALPALSDVRLWGIAILVAAAAAGLELGPLISAILPVAPTPGVSP